MENGKLFRTSPFKNKSLVQIRQRIGTPGNQIRGGSNLREVQIRWEPEHAVIEDGGGGGGGGGGF